MVVGCCKKYAGTCSGDNRIEGMDFDQLMNSYVRGGVDTLPDLTLTNMVALCGSTWWNWIRSIS